MSVDSADSVKGHLRDRIQVVSSHTTPSLASSASDSDQNQIGTMSATPLTENGVSTDLGHDPPKLSASQKVANVWDLRKEQMARSKAAASLPNTSGQPPNHQPTHSPTLPTPSSALNGHLDDPLHDDPFVVRPGRSSQMVRSASMRLEPAEVPSKASIFPSSSAHPVAVREDWPEVGRSRNSIGEPSRGLSFPVEHQFAQSRTAKGHHRDNSSQEARAGADGSRPSQIASSPSFNSVRPSQTHSGIANSTLNLNATRSLPPQFEVHALPSSASYSGILPPPAAISESQTHTGIVSQSSPHPNTSLRMQMLPNPSSTTKTPSTSSTPSLAGSQVHGTTSQSHSPSESLAPSSVQSASQPHSRVHSTTSSSASSIAPSSSHSRVNSRLHSPFSNSTLALHASPSERTTRLPSADELETGTAPIGGGLTFGFIPPDYGPPHTAGFLQDEDSTIQPAVVYPQPSHHQALPFLQHISPLQQHPPHLPLHQWTSSDSHYPASTSAVPLPSISPASQHFGTHAPLRHDWKSFHEESIHQSAVPHQRSPQHWQSRPLQVDIVAAQASSTNEGNEQRQAVVFGNVGLEDDGGINPALGPRRERASDATPRPSPVFAIGLRLGDLRIGPGTTKSVEKKDKKRGLKIQNREVIDLTEDNLGMLKTTWKFGSTDVISENEISRDETGETDGGLGGGRGSSDGGQFESSNGLEKPGMHATGQSEAEASTFFFPVDSRPGGMAVGHAEYGAGSASDHLEGRREWETRGEERYMRDRVERDRDSRDEQDGGRELKERMMERPLFHPPGGRHRRGSSSYVPSGGSYERGGFSGRRGRGGNYGRGYRYPRGGGGYQARQAGFMVTPPAQFQPLPDPGTTVFFPPPAPPPLHYIGAVPGYDSYPPPPLQHPRPPVPTPVSVVQFPLDPIRWQLLGQLEYYLSPQNMASDFFLRQKMDSCGWIPISLIASFNRVRQLTQHEQLVKDVLTLSSVVEVMNDSVRMLRWESFVLPDAPKSTVENASAEQEAEEDEEDEEVEFVMGREAGWTPDPHSS